MSPVADTPGLSRRAVLGGVGAGIVGAGVLASSAWAESDGEEVMTGGASTIALLTTATALKPNLRYVLVSGHDLAPILSPSDYTTIDGRFRFLGTSWGYAGALLNLPIGSVIKEVEMYGARGATGAVSLELWKTSVATGTAELSAEAATPIAAGEFTVTFAADELQDAASKSTPFANIGGTAASAAEIRGIRVGYMSPVTALTPINPARVYDSRAAAYAPNNGMMARNTNRVISVKDGRDAAGTVTVADVVPDGAVAVAINVTVSGPTGPNFLSVVPGDAATYTTSTINWPGGFDAANGAIVKLDASRQLKVFCGDQTGSTHVIVDVTGYYR